VNFRTVAEYFEKIEAESSRLAMTTLLADVLEQATPDEAAIIVNLSLGQLHPLYVGAPLGMAEKGIITIVSRLLNQNEESIEQAIKKEGDIGRVISNYTWQATGSHSVTQVYKTLCQLEETTGIGSQEKKAALLKDLLVTLTPLEAKFIARIVIGKLRLGFSDMTIVDALSWMTAGDKSERETIEHAYNICADIGYITETLKHDGIEALKAMQIRVGTPIRPAAAERLPTAAAIVEKLGPCIAQPKLDGFRVQVHLDKTGKTPAVHFYSRKLQDMSAIFPDLLKSVTKLNVETLICEGEAIAYDAQTGSFLPFQETAKRKRKHGVKEAAEEFPLRLIIFDLLYLNGNSELDKTHEERRAALEQIIPGPNNKDAIVRLVGEKKIETAEQLEEYFKHSISAGLEGLVVKRPDATYQPGKRNFNWIKLKRQEEGHLEDTIDCVILGYYAGSGKRAAFGIGAFLVGVYNQDDDRFETIAKIGTGLSDKGWQELKQKCDEIAVKQKPVNITCAKDLYPDVWCTPQIVVAIRADEITQSPLHSTGKTETELGYALRFPRIMDYRIDKGPYDATTAKEVKRLYEDQFTSR